MELVQKFLNIVLPPITFIIYLCLFPYYLAFKFYSFIKRHVSSENVAGKVVIVTGAASGIGEQIAYEYAKRGANLVLVDMKEEQLRQVEREARHYGSLDVIVVQADVSIVDDCKRYVEAAVNHFGKLDHLVNNAGIARIGLLQDVDNILDLTPTMEVNFWGSVYGTHFAMPHLKKSKGKIIVIASTCGWYPLPALSIYNASKAAIISFHETLRTEIGEAIGITIVTPGLIKSDMSRPYAHHFQKGMFSMPLESKEECGKAIVRSACRGDKYLVEPSWVRVLHPFKSFFPEFTDYGNRWVFKKGQRKYSSRKKN